MFTEKRYVCWPSAAIVNFQIESNITFQKRDKNLFQNFKTPFILMQFSNETIKWTKTAKQFLFYFHSFNFGFQFLFLRIGRKFHKFKTNKKEIINNQFVKAYIKHCLNSFISLVEKVREEIWERILQFF